jgi:tol-pal system beta propeller repeat protein TolB
MVEGFKCPSRKSGGGTMRSKPFLLPPLLVFFLALFAAMPEAHGVTGGLNGRIAFDSNRKGGFNFDIFVMRHDGTNVRRVTHSTHPDENPTWSPRKGRIAFDSRRHKNLDIYVIKPDGTGLRRLTTDPAADFDPAWSPHGRRIAFVSKRSGHGDIYVLDRVTGAVTRVTTNPAFDGTPDWAPGGGRIAFQSDRSGTPNIFTIRPDGTGLKRVTHDPFPTIDQWPSWNPGGGLIAFVKYTATSQQIFTVKPDGTGETQLTHSGIFKGNLAWAPSGLKIAFAGGSPIVGSYDIFVIRADGSHYHRLKGGTSPAQDTDPSWQARPQFE